MQIDLDVRPVVAATLRALGEPNRSRIVAALAREELCVCHLVDDLGMSQSLVSHHLRILRQAGLVGTSRHSYWTYYRLEPEAVAEAADFLVGLRAVGDGAAPPDRRPCC